MKFVISLILLVCSVSSLDKVRIPYFVNVVNTDKIPPDRICGGVLVHANWALSSRSCIESLYKLSQNVILTAGHSEDKEPNHTSKVTMVPVVANEVPKETVLALRLKKPITKNSMISWAKLPLAVGFPVCEHPKSVVFQPKIENFASSGARRTFSFISGLISYEQRHMYQRQPHPKHKRNNEAPRSSDEEMEKSGPRIIKIKGQKQACQPFTGWPLMCNAVVAGIEVNCQRLDANQIESEYVNLLHYIDEITRIVNSGLDKHRAETIAPHVVHFGAKPAAKNEASCHGGVWKRNVLFALTTLLFSGILRYLTLNCS